MRREETKLVLRWVTFVALLSVLAAVSWSVISQSAALYRTTPAFRKMDRVEVTLLNDEGELVSFEVRVADEDDERSAGFANIGAGVIRRTVILWMINRETTIDFRTQEVEAPIELAYLNGEGKVLGIQAGKPFAAEPIPFGIPFQFVLEAPAGFFAQRPLSTNGSALTPTSLRALKALLGPPPASRPQ